MFFELDSVIRETARTEKKQKHNIIYLDNTRYKHNIQAFFQQNNL